MAKKKDTTVYTHISETVNNVTGEVVSTKKDEVIRREKTPQFIMLFTEGEIEVFVYTNQGVNLEFQ